MFTQLPTHESIHSLCYTCSFVVYNYPSPLIALSTARAQLFSVLQVLLHPASLHEFESLHTSIESLTFALCRLPLVHSFIMTPPVLMGGGAVSEKVLDQGLMESEVSYNKAYYGPPLHILASRIIVTTIILHGF